MTVMILLLFVVAPLLILAAASSATSSSSATTTIISSDASQRQRVDHRHSRRSLSAVFAVADEDEPSSSSSRSSSSLLDDESSRELWHVWHPVRTSYYGGSKAGKAASSKGSKSISSLTSVVYVVKQADNGAANNDDNNNSSNDNSNDESDNEDVQESESDSEDDDSEEDDNDEDSYNSNDTNDNGDSVSKDDADDKDDESSHDDDDADENNNKPTMMPTTSSIDNAHDNVEPTIQPTMIPTTTTIHDNDDDEEDDEPTDSPTIAPTKQQDNDNDDIITDTPTILPTTTTTMPTIAPSSSTDDEDSTTSPTVSYSPTTALISPSPRSNLTMQLFGLSSSSSSNSIPLSDIQVVYYNERTARYIESFYNDDDNDSNNDDDENDDNNDRRLLQPLLSRRRSDNNIATAIVGVKAIVEITSQTAITIESNNDNNSNSNSDNNRYSQSSVLVAVGEGGGIGGDGNKTDSTVVRYRKHQQNNVVVQQFQYNQQLRQLQDDDEEEEDEDEEEEDDEEEGSEEDEDEQEQEDEKNCSSNESIITFTIKLEYRTVGVGTMDELLLDEIIAEPFSTPNYRDQYITYLNGDDMDFEELTCTSAIDFPSSDDEGDGETKSPTVVTKETAAPITSSPTTGTTPPTPAVVNTLAPSVSNDTLIPSIQPSVSFKPTPILSLMVTAPPSTSPVITTLTLPPVITNLTLPPFLSSSNIVNEVVSGFEGLVDNASSSIMDNILPGGVDDGGTTPPVSTPSQVMTVIEGSTSSSSSPSISTDDIFDNIPRSRIAPLNATLVRQCTDIIQTLSSRGKPLDEFEVSFVYGVETLTEDVSYIGNLENLILDLVAKSVLRCDSNGAKKDVIQSSVDAVQQLRSTGVGEGGEMEYIGVVKIRYPRRGQVTTISNCDPDVNSFARGCAILSSKLFVSSIGVPVAKVHSDIIEILSYAIREETFVDFIPELLTTTFLGPDPLALTFENTVINTERSDIINPWLIVLYAVGFSIVLLLFVLMCSLYGRCHHRKPKLSELSEDEHGLRHEARLGIYRDCAT